MQYTTNEDFISIFFSDASEINQHFERQTVTLFILH